MATKRKRTRAKRSRGQQFGAKAAFIRKHPELSAREVVDSAAKSGLTIRLPQVYKVRSAETEQGQPGARGRSPRPRASSKPVGEHPSKSAFIRSLPRTMTAKLVVEAAAAQGIAISETFVYNVRAAAKKRGEPLGDGATTGGAARSGAAGAEAAFRRLVLDLGLPRAKRLLAEMESRLAALIDGR